MDNKMNLEIITPERVVLKKEIGWIEVPGEDGEFEVVSNHVPFMTTTAFGVVRISNSLGEEKEELIIVGKGFVEINKNNIKLLVNTAELSKEIDKKRALEAKERAEQRLSKESADNVDFSRARAALERALTRIKVRDMIYG